MTDPISVLLIIGAAVVGPIEPLRITNGIYWYTECVKAHGGLEKMTDRQNRACASLKDSRRLVSTETVAETCARVMKEIGARRSAAGWEIDQTRVYCVPAPRGMR